MEKEALFLLINCFYALWHHSASRVGPMFTNAPPTKKATFCFSFKREPNFEDQGVSKSVNTPSNVHSEFCMLLDSPTTAGRSRGSLGAP